jgi:hypothetical protein
VTASGEIVGEEEPSELRVYEIASGKRLAKLNGGGEARWSPDGRSFVVARQWSPQAGDLVLYEARTGRAIRTFPVLPGGATIAPAFSADGASIAAVTVPLSGGGGELLAWTVATGAVVARAAIATSGFSAATATVAWYGPGVVAASDDSSDLLLLRLADGESVRVRFARVGEKMGYLAFTRQGVFDLQGLPPEAVRFREGRDVAHARLSTVAQVARLARPGLVGDLLAGKSVTP